MSKSNEYYFLRSAAKHLVVDLWRSHAMWDAPERILDVYPAVKLLREIADTLPDKKPTDLGRWSWECW